MSFTVDYSTDVGKVRALINDVNPDNQQFQDAQLQSLIDTNDGIIPLAASAALLSLAMQFSTRGKIKIMDVEVDSVSVVKDLRALAKQLRDDYEEAPDFDIAKMLVTPSAYCQDLENELLQNGTTEE